jgi:hypothetical protein
MKKMEKNKPSRFEVYAQCRPMVVAVFPEIPMQTRENVGGRILLFNSEKM